MIIVSRIHWVGKTPNPIQLLEPYNKSYGSPARNIQKK